MYCFINILYTKLDNNQFISIKLEDLDDKYIFYILFKKYKEINTYYCKCRKRYFGIYFIY